ncbi:hypothetical protein V5P93_002914 [Actinokineospora auranticolor]|uniref:Uncharacterized protein n=1 Tax=Actinokineospora auranticolor TaxID=155976 RepID=A0A2S6H0V8_9PSEU|nr:hypothetical protein [Actinokineospora auranticolor]PPK71056.1 hypothetical protein CLV40_101242 [Actinokineospora auranticolor]
MTMRRETRAVIVAVESPVGTVSTAVDELSAHLPTRDRPMICPLCSTEKWPCARFRAAADLAVSGDVRLEDLIPPDLRPRLWPSVRSGS